MPYKDRKSRTQGQVSKARRTGKTETKKPTKRQPTPSQQMEMKKVDALRKKMWEGQPMSNKKIWEDPYE